MTGNRVIAFPTLSSLTFFFSFRTIHIAYNENYYQGDIMNRNDIKYWSDALSKNDAELAVFRKKLYQDLNSLDTVELFELRSLLSTNSSLVELLEIDANHASVLTDRRKWYQRK